MAKLRHRQEVAERTVSFSFDKPAGWTFRTGQFIDITQINPAETDAEGNTRGFSISSAPYQDDPALRSWSCIPMILPQFAALKRG
jgi:ferredoxin-NADP reductase